MSPDGKTCMICGENLPTTNTDKDMEDHCKTNHHFLYDIFGGGWKFSSRFYYEKDKPDWIKSVKLTKQQFAEIKSGIITNYFKPPMQDFLTDSFLARDLGTAQTRASGFYLLITKKCQNAQKKLVLEQKVLASTECYEMFRRLGTLAMENEAQQMNAQKSFFDDLNAARQGCTGSKL